MSWYSSNYKNRAPIVIDNTAGGAGSIDVQFTVDPDFADLWDVVRSDGADIKVTAADGITALTWSKSFTYSTRSLTISIDGMTAAGAGLVIAWLYWGYSGETSAGTSATTISSPKSAVIEIGRAMAPYVPVMLARAGDTKPVAVVQKSSSDKLFIWFDFAACLDTRRVPYQGQLLWEEIDRVSNVEVLSNGADDATRHLEASTTMIHHATVKAVVRAGTSGNDYTVQVTVYTTSGQIRQGHALLKVLDPSEA